MKAPWRTAFLAAWYVLGTACRAAVPTDPAEIPAEAGRLSFDVTEGTYLNSFLQAGPVAAHLVLRAGTEPRILIAFPAGDSGVGVWFSATRHPVAWSLDGRPQPLTLHDANGRPLNGIVLRASAAAPDLSLRQVLLSSVRVLRDYQTFGSVPAEVRTLPDEHGPTLAWSRDRLDGAAGYRLSLEVTHGTLRDGHMVAASDGRIGLKITALSGDTPLTPLSSRELLLNPARGDRSAQNVLRFLSYREKFLAGSWRYATYFGRDTLMSLRLLLPVLSPGAVEDGLGSVLARLSSSGEVAHEEEIGEFAILHHLHAGDGRSDAPILDYKMVDSSFMLAPVALEWLLDDLRGSSRATAFLARNDGGYGRAPRPFGADLVANLRFVTQKARPFAAEPQASHLIGLKPGVAWGQWRDSDDGIGHGRYPYDVNAIFVPAALAAAGRLYTSGLLDPYMTDNDRALLSRAEDWAGIWRAKAAALFNIEVQNDTARRRIEAYAGSVGVPADPALESIGDSAVRFHALALDGDGGRIPIMNSDDGFELLFGNPGAQWLERTISMLMRPFPAGLMTGVGLLVANPVFATSELEARFTAQAYHGTVIWSWQQAVLAAGLARQLKRRDLPSPLRDRLRRAQKTLWRAIEAGKEVINSELWSWSYRDGRYRIAPFAPREADSNESNAAQLWSTVYLAVHPPTP